MKIDMHTHCVPASECAHHEPELLPEMFKKAGIDAIVLTNHCFPRHCDRLSTVLSEQAEFYVDNYRCCKAAGEKIGFSVFFGVELKLINEPGGREYLLYGIREEDFIESFPMYNWSQKELFDYCNEKDIPYLGGCVTPTEVMTAISYGCKIIKFFPCSNYGGLPTMKALAAAFPQVTFLPTGGISDVNLAEYLKWEKIFAVGGSWMMKGTPDEIAQKCKEAVEIAKSVN